MAHNLNYNELQREYSYAGVKPAWHKLGKVVESDMTAEEAIKYALLDYPVIKEPVYHQKNDGTFEIVKGTYCTKRADTEAYFGTVGNKYTILQNNNAFKFFDTIVGEGKAIYQSVGALGKGEVIFIVAKLPEQYHIPGDESTIEQFLVLTNGHDGNHQLSVYYTPISVCCQNTLNASLQKNSHKLTIRHTASLQTKLNTAAKLMGIVDKVSEQDRNLLSFLATEKLSLMRREEIVSSIFKSANPEAEESSKMKNIITSFYAYSESPVSDSYRSLRGTKYAFYQDITGWIQHVKNKGNAEKNMRLIMQENGNYSIASKALNLLSA